MNFTFPMHPFLLFISNFELVVLKLQYVKVSDRLIPSIEQNFYSQIIFELNFFDKKPKRQRNNSYEGDTGV